MNSSLTALNFDEQLNALPDADRGAKYTFTEQIFLVDAAGDFLTDASGNFLVTTTRTTAYPQMIHALSEDFKLTG